MKIIFKFIIVGIVLLLIYVKLRGYFWKDKIGNKLSFKEFIKRFKEGTEKITPLQQTNITLMSYIPIKIGILYGIYITILTKVFWMTFILIGSLPITLIQFLSSYQKFKRLKIIDKSIKEASNQLKDENSMAINGDKNA